MIKKIIHYLFRSILYCIAALLSLVLVLMLCLQIELIKKPILNWTKQQIEQQSGYQLEYTNVDGLLPFSLHIHNLKAQKNYQSVFSVEKVDLGLSPMMLLDGSLVLNFVGVEGLKIDKTHESAVETISGENLDVILPKGLTIHHFLIKDIQFKNLPPLNIEGSFDLNPRTQEMYFVAQFMTGCCTTSPSVFEIDIHPKDKTYEVIYKIKETAGGYISKELNSILFKSFQITGSFESDLQPKIHELLTTGSLSLPVINGHFIFETEFEHETKIPHHLTLKGDYVFDPEGSLRLSSINGLLQNTPFSPPVDLLVEGSLSLTNNWKLIETNLHISIEDINHWETTFNIPMQGSLDLNTHLAGTWPYIMVNVIADAKNLKVHSYHFNEISLNSYIYNTKEMCKGTYHIGGLFSDFPLTSSGEITWDKQGVLQLNKFQLNSYGAGVEGNIHFNIFTHEISSDIHLNANELSLHPFKQYTGHDLKGEIALEGSVSGTLFAPKIQLNGNGKDFAFNDHHFEQIELDVSAARHNEGIQGHVKANGITRSLPFDGSSNYLYVKNQEVMLENISLSLNQSNVKGDVKFSLVDYLLEGTLEGDLKNLQELSEITKFPLEGTLHTLAVFTTDKTGIYPAQHVNLKLEGTSLSSDQWKVRSLTADADLKDIFNQPHSSITISAKDASRGFLNWHQLYLSTQITDIKSPWSFTLKGSGDVFGKIEGFLTGVWNFGANGFVSTVEVFDGSFSGQHFKLQKPFDIRVDKNAFLLSPLAIKMDKGFIEAQALLTPDIIDSKFSIDHLPIPILNMWYNIPVPVEGNVSLLASLSGSPVNPKGNIELTVDQFHINQEIFSNLPIAYGKIHATIEDYYLVFKGALENISHIPFTIEGKLPLELSITPLKFNLKDTKNLSIKGYGEGEIGNLLKLLFTSTTILTGHLKTSIEILGTIKHPQVVGEAYLTNGSYESLGAGTVFRNVTASFKGDTDRLLITQLSGDDGRSGTIAGSGYLDFNREAQFPYIVEVDINNSELLRHDYAHASASGHLTFKGNMKAGNLVGNLDLHEATINIPDEMPAELKSIDVTYINQPESCKNPLKLVDDPKSWPIYLDINLNIPECAYISGRNLTSEWQGNIHFIGTTDDPLFGGSATLMSGEYEFTGKRFVGNQGVIQFNGEANKTTLYISAEYQIDNVMVEAIIKGPLQDPILAFRSNPSMSKKEILSLILFNKQISEITPFQGAELSQTVISLGGSDNTDVFSRLRNSIGIDRVDISSVDTCDENEVTLKVGKYISRGIFVSLNRSMTAETNQVSIQASVTDHIKVEAEVGDDSEATVSLKWETRY